MGGGGVLRAAKFVKYLPEFGWRPVVLTLDPRYYYVEVMDETLAQQLPDDLAIYRTPSLKPRALTRAEMADLHSTAPSQGQSLRPRALARRAKRWLEARFLLPTDSGFLWHPYARRALRRILREQAIDAVLTTSPPHDVHWLGATANRAAHLPWVAEFRDEWLSNPAYQSPSRARKALERWQERRIVQRADRIVCVTDRHADDLAERHGAQVRAKTHVLYNGFDPADFQAEQPTAPATTQATGARSDEGVSLRMAHVGAAGGRLRPIQTLIAALRLLQQEGPPYDRIRLDFIGNMLQPEDAECASSTSGVAITGFVPHAQAVAAMYASDVLVQIQGRELAWATSGKLYEYAATQRPILTLTVPGSLWDFVESRGWGMVSNIEDTAAIAAALRELVERKRAGTLDALAPTPESIRPYSRYETTRRLAALLDEISG